MKVHGNRIYILMPKLKDYNFTLDPKTQRELNEEELAKFDRLEVFAVGDKVENIKKGDIVYIDPFSIRKSFPIKVDGTDIIVFNQFDIAHTW